MMRSSSIGTLVLGVVLALSAFTPTRSDEAPPTYHRHRYVHRWHPTFLPREQHVIEQVRNGISTDFVMNGTWFSGIGDCALGWTAGDRVRLLDGDWNGYCESASFYNASRRRTCELACR
ncbi:MAG: hypothetical protein ACLPKB_16950 [Xanthobacteraceae bacterium]